MNFITKFSIILLPVCFVVFCQSVSLPDCLVTDLSNCGSIIGILCDGNTNKCECQEGYEFNPLNTDLKDACLKYPLADISISPSQGHSWTMVIILMLTIVLNMCALIFIARRYHLVNWVRQKLLTRRNSGVTYEDVMIGQDDPPISA